MGARFRVVAAGYAAEENPPILVKFCQGRSLPRRVADPMNDGVSKVIGPIGVHLTANVLKCLHVVKAIPSNTPAATFDTAGVEEASQ